MSRSPEPEVSSAGAVSCGALGAWDIFFCVREISIIDFNLMKACEFDKFQFSSWGELCVL